MTQPPDSPAFRLGVEQRGIEFIPREQRYGTPLRLFFVWFGVNLSILCLTVGMLGISAGLGLEWCFVALVLGNLIGTFFMAAHAVQGPHLGIPQMIQSRAQFGVLGASLPLIAVLFSTTLYASANAILIEGTLRILLPVNVDGAIVLFGAVTVLLAFFGYELIHRLATALTLLSGTLFLTVAILLLKQDAPVHVTAISANHFSGSAFILVVTQATAWSLSSAPTVADYSRYLPVEVSSARTFWCTGLGNFLASTLMMMLGAYLAASFPEIAGHAGIGIARLFGPAQLVAAILITANLLQVNIMSLYSAYMSSTTIVSSIRGMRRVTLSYKLGSMLLLMGIATGIALATRDNFDAYFSDLLAFLVYTLIPWSAINLVDFYWVRHGKYDIDAIFDLNGIYGRIRWRTILIYLFSIAMQIPFVSLSFYRGPIAHLIGADIAWAPGTLVPALLYYLTHASVHRWGRKEDEAEYDMDAAHPKR
jgi:nucleobase:cation symporter-1, NCS1 family